MARGDQLRAGLADRIRTSAITLTVKYPPKRQVLSGAAPAPRPSSPLTGTPPPAAVEEAPTTPGKTAVAMPCLWLDSVAVALGADQRTATTLAYVATATALARVLVSDAAVDTDNPWGATVFDDCELVECQGKEYRVLAVEPVSASFYLPHTYAVWLRGVAVE